MKIPDVSILLTRFSLPHPIWTSRSVDEYAAWLEVRLELLERFTVPSVRNLYVKPDRWLIFAGAHEVEFIKRIEKVAQMSGVGVTIVQFKGKTIPAALSEVISNDIDLPIRLCTVRMDSDDMIASDYFARLRSLIEPVTYNDDFAISFPGGAVYDSLANQFGYLSYPENAFLAHVEQVTDWGKVKSVYRSMHTTLCSDLSNAIYARSNHPMWCSVVHEHNLANQSLLRDISLTFSENDILMRKFGLTANQYSQSNRRR